MSGTEILTAVIAVLSVIVSLVAAVHARRSADQAQAAERRASEGERLGAWRELSRTKLELEAEADSALRMVDAATLGTRSAFVASGGPGGSREKVILDELDRRRSELEKARHTADGVLPSADDASAVFARQVEIDGALVRVREERDGLVRQLQGQQAERAIDQLRKIAVR